MIVKGQWWSKEVTKEVTRGVVYSSQEAKEKGMGYNIRHEGIIRIGHGKEEA